MMQLITEKNMNALAVGVKIWHCVGNQIFKYIIIYKDPMTGNITYKIDNSTTPALTPKYYFDFVATNDWYIPHQ